MKELIRIAIRKIEGLFTFPDYWMIVDRWYKNIFITIYGIVLTMIGIVLLCQINYLFTKKIIYAIFLPPIGSFIIFYGISLLRSVFCNLYYSIQISISGEIIDGLIQNSDKSSHHTCFFAIEYKAPLPNHRLEDFRQRSSIKKNHFHWKKVENARYFKIKYWKKDPKKIKILWRY